jgi:HEAT repeat protein
VKPLSERARNAIARLHEGSGLTARILGKTWWNLSAIEKLSRCNEPAVIPFITPILVSGTRAQVLAAAQVIEALLSRAAAQDLASIDESMRRSDYGEAWRLEPRELAKWVGPGEPGILLLQLSSFHANGFVREEAIRRLSLIRDGSELPYLLLRLNDWVPQVRHAAHGAVLDRLRPDYTASFVKALALVVRLQEARRADHSDVLEGISRLLAGPAARHPMIATMSSSSKEVRRASFRFLTEGKSDELPEILLASLRVADPVIRLWAARAAAASLDRDQLREVLDAFSLDPSAPVRQEVLRAWITSFPADGTEKLVSGLLDNSAAVRAEARFHLGKTTNLDLAQCYRDAMATNRASVLVAAMSGLAETGSSVDADKLVPHLSHPLAKVRKTAVRYLIRLGGDQYLDMVVPTVLDVSSGVSNQACKAVEAYAARIGATCLWALLEKPAAGHVGKNLLRLLAALPKWESIVYLVRAVGEKDESLTAQARDYVLRWDTRYNRSQSAPSAEQLAKLEAALSKAESRLPSATVTSMRFAIDSFAQ